MEGADQFVRLQEPAEGRMGEDLVGTVGQGTVRIGQKRPVLVRQEETGGNRIDPDAFAELGAQFAGEPLRPAGHPRLGDAITGDAGQRTEGRHGAEIDDGTLPACNQTLGKDLGRKDGPEYIEIDHTAGRFDVQVENRLLGRDVGRAHVAAGGIQEDVNPAPGSLNRLTVLLQDALFQHIGRQEHGLTAAAADGTDDGLALLPGTFQVQQDHFGPLGREITDDGLPQHPAGTGHHDHFSFDVKQIIHRNNIIVYEHKNRKNLWKLKDFFTNFARAMAKQIKIKEIAAMAGVSAGTVDRILHGRGNVSDAKREAVEAVLAQVGYKFNIHTSAVSLKRGYHFIVTTPEPGECEYWDSLIEGISQAQEEYSDIQLQLDYCPYNQFDERSCENTFKDIPDRMPDGVIIGPTFRKETVALCEALDKKNIPYVFVDAHIDGTHPVASYTVDQLASGALIGKIASSGLHDGRDIILFRSGRRGEERSSNTVSREKGLLDFLQRQGLGDHIVQAIIPQAENAEEIIIETLNGHPNVQCAIVLNSRGHVIARAIRQSGKQGQIQLLGFDLTKSNITALEDGTISVLLGQRPRLQGFSALRRLISFLLYRSKQEDERHYLPIDLLVKENLPYYQEVLKG